MNVTEKLDNRICNTKASSPVSQAIVFWRSACNWWRGIMRVSRRRQKRLRLCESLPLGERRFVAVVEFEHSRFLIGGTQGSLVLLAPLQNIAIPEEMDQNGSRTAAPITKIPSAWGAKP